MLRDPGATLLPDHLLERNRPAGNRAANATVSLSSCDILNTSSDIPLPQRPASPHVPPIRRSDPTSSAVARAMSFGPSGSRCIGKGLAWQCDALTALSYSPTAVGYTPRTQSMQRPGPSVRLPPLSRARPPLQVTQPPRPGSVLECLPAGGCRGAGPAGGCRAAGPAGGCRAAGPNGAVCDCAK